MNTLLNIKTCPLCQTASDKIFHQDKARAYIRCQTCYLIFVPETFFLSKEEEKSRYDLHQNSPLDPGYRKFLNRLFNPLAKLLSHQSSGLDFGCGPGPTLSVMFEEKGHTVKLYDYFYHPDTSVLQQKYDFITATEALEHLHHPQKDLNQIWSCLKPDGYLGIMTKHALELKDFTNWHYKNDSTHVCFFSQKTFKWLAGKWQADLTFADKDVVIFHKQP